MSAEKDPNASTMLKEVAEGLHSTPKRLPSKYFYDERGSRLFEQITRLKEYYPTRCERQILQQNIDEISHCIAPKSVLVELGSGSSKKTRLLLDHCPDLTAYVPVEISQQYLTSVVEDLRREYPTLLVQPVCADYTRSFQLPVIEKAFDYYVIFYPGSTIGNFQPEQAQRFLGSMARFLVPGGGLLIGVDLKKDPNILEAAYNDRQGMTVAFNKNMLVRLNRELASNFQVDQFRHKAFYNAQKGRIEMHLESCKQQSVQLDGKQIRFEQGETIHTENSYKYSLKGFETLVAEWFDVKKVWTDENDLFSLQYLVKK